MRRYLKQLLAGAFVLAAMSAAQIALADTLTYEITWSGHSPFGGSDSDASCSATLTMDAKYFLDLSYDMAKVETLSVTVQNAASGNGTFGKSDYSMIAIPYRFAPDLVLGERYQLSSYELYDFALFSNAPGAPTSVANFMMLAGGPGGVGTDALYLSSIYVTRTFTSAVPEPASYAMLAAGLGLIGFAARRKART